MNHRPRLKTSHTRARDTREVSRHPTYRLGHTTWAAHTHTHTSSMQPMVNDSHSRFNILTAPTNDGHFWLVWGGAQSSSIGMRDMDTSAAAEDQHPLSRPINTSHRLASTDEDKCPVRLPRMVRTPRCCDATRLPAHSNSSLVVLYGSLSLSIVATNQPSLPPQPRSWKGTTEGGTASLRNQPSHKHTHAKPPPTRAPSPLSRMRSC